MDSTTLFHRLVSRGRRCDDRESFFSYEMAPVPMSLFLFKDGFMRKPDKPALGKAIKEGLLFIQYPKELHFVVGGGALLHKVQWLRNTTIIDVINQYINYL